MKVAITQVDAFSSRAFGGNPAAVCILDHAADDAWMQSVAAEMNLAETAFLRRRADGDWELRWFTPNTEVDLCGHATLASAHVLWERGAAPASAPVRFHTRSGVLGAERQGDEIELDFPAEPANAVSAPPQLTAIGAIPCWVGRNRMDYLVVVDDERTVRALRPDLGRLAELPVRGVIVTARASTEGFDFVSRFFAPAVAVPEDPVTGSAHCCLAPYWGGVLGKTEMVGWQASERGGRVRVRLVGDRVKLAGPAVTVLEGTLHT
jgi:predicted PhzF superfamily epimerase YddE/YHI9